jgi:hypothetical protein
MAVEDLARVITPKQRAGYAEDTLQSFLHAVGGENIADAAEDLIECIGHWCDRNDVNFRQIVERALQGWNTNASIARGCAPEPLHIEILTNEEYFAREMERTNGVSDAIENALAREREVTLPEDFHTPGIPEEWFDKPFCRISYRRDPGDLTVGILSFEGYQLDEDQEGTVVGDMIEALAVEAAR